MTKQDRAVSDDAVTPEQGSLESSDVVEPTTPPTTAEQEPTSPEANSDS